MDDELVLLTSYFNLAGGRRQDAADTFRVDPSLPSGTSPDGAAALYVVTESSAAGHMGPRARRLAADTVAWEYSTHGDDQPAPRLKAALRTAHDEVLREFDGHVSVGLTVIAVERDTVYLAQVAPAQVYVLHEGHLHSIPATVPGTQPFSRGLGSKSGPQISVFRDQIQPGDVVSLCSSWFHRAADAEELRECFGAGTADDIAESLLDLGKVHDVRDVTAIVVEVALASDLEAEQRDGEPAGFVEQVDVAVQALAGVGRMLWSELQAVPVTTEPNGHSDDTPIPEPEPAPVEATSATAAPPEEPVEVEQPDPLPPYSADLAKETFQLPPDAPAPWEEEAAPVPASRPPEQSTEEVPIVSPAEAEMPTASAIDLGQVEAPEPAQPTPAALETADDQQASSPVETEIEQERVPQPPPKPVPEPEPMSELEQVNSRLQNGPDMADVIPPVQAFPDTSTEPERIYATSKDIQAVNRRPRRFAKAGRDPLAGPPVVRPGLQDIDLRHPVGRPAPPAIIWLSTAVVCILAAVSLFVFIKHHRVTLPNRFPAIALADIKKAKSASSPQLQDRYLGKARRDISNARLSGSTPTQVRTLNAKLLAATDSLHHITRVTAPVLLTDFGKFPNAKPTEIATAPGMVFVLDSGRKSVFSIVPNATANPTEIVQTGETYNGSTVGLPTHVATDGTTALVLDDHNILVRDAAGTKTATPLTQITQTPQKVVSMTTLDPDVYLLDTANSQVWRYPFGVSGFNPQASAYFTPTQPNLSHAISVALDPNDMFILQSNGQVLKFDIQANPQKFTVDPRAHLQHPVQLYTATGLNYVWIADAGSGRIVQLDKSGGFVRAYVAGGNGMDLSTVKSLSIGPSGNTIYVLTGSRIYEFPIVH